MYCSEPPNRASVDRDSESKLIPLIRSFRYIEEDKIMLLVPRRWLGYRIELNDLLPDCTEILDRFELSEIPLHDTFGSNTDYESAPDRTIISVGEAVEPERFLELIELLDGLNLDFVMAIGDTLNRKDINIGSLNLGNEPMAALSESLLSTVRHECKNAAQFAECIKSCAKVFPLP